MKYKWKVRENDGLVVVEVGPQCVFLAGVCWPRGTDRLSAFF